MLEDDTGHRFATSHRCYGNECPTDPPKSDKYSFRPKYDSLVQIKKYEDEISDGMPWEGNAQDQYDENQMELNVKRFELASDGQTQKEIHDGERKAQEETQKKQERKVPQVPADMIIDDTGNHYATSHRCFGKECPTDPPKSDKYSVRPVFTAESLA